MCKQYFRHLQSRDPRIPCSDSWLCICIELCNSVIHSDIPCRHKTRSWCKSVHTLNDGLQEETWEGNWIRQCINYQSCRPSCLHWSRPCLWIPETNSILQQYKCKTTLLLSFNWIVVYGMWVQRSIQYQGYQEQWTSWFIHECGHMGAWCHKVDQRLCGRDDEWNVGLLTSLIK